MEALRQKPLIGAYLMLFEGGRVLLSKSCKGALQGRYSMVAGHVEEGETVIQAVIREAKEEADITLSPDDLNVVVIMHRPKAPYNGTPTDIIDFFIEARTYQGRINNKEPDKCEKLEFFDTGGLPEQTMPHVAEALSMHANRKFFACYVEKSRP